MSDWRCRRKLRYPPVIRRVYVAEALDLWICATCRTATCGPPPCDHSSPIRVERPEDVRAWWRVRLLARSRLEVDEILHVSGERAVLAVARGRRTPGRIGVRWGQAEVDG